MLAEHRNTFSKDAEWYATLEGATYRRSTYEYSMYSAVCVEMLNLLMDHEEKAGTVGTEEAQRILSDLIEYTNLRERECEAQGRDTGFTLTISAYNFIRSKLHRQLVIIKES